MRDALRLMAKVFAVVFGAGAAVVVLGYLVLGGLYVYKRIETPSQQSNETAAQSGNDILAKKHGGTVETGTFAPLYDPKDLPDVLPDAHLDCEDKNGPWLKYSGKAPLCSVQIDGKVAAVISRQEVKDNLAGWVTVPPCPANDPLGLNAKSSCTPLPGRR
jgi:hypothetical protein